IVKWSRGLPILAATAVLLPVSRATAQPTVDLATTYPGAGTIVGDVGGTAIYSTIVTLPAGTGVFDPFLTIQRKGVEQGYNTSQRAYLDGKGVPQLTHDLHVGELAVINIGGVDYYAFELDASETGVGNRSRLLSIDNIRIYTSARDTAALVANNVNKLDNLGILRYAQNRFIEGVENWVLIDASRSDG